MTALHKNVEEMLARLAQNSQGELEFMQRLSDAVRRVDEQLLREVRSVAIQHELRREAILGELQTLASRLCALPAPHAAGAKRPAIDQQAHLQGSVAINAGGADWRQAAQNINDDHNEFDFTFQAHGH